MHFAQLIGSQENHNRSGRFRYLAAELQNTTQIKSEKSLSVYTESSITLNLIKSMSSR